MNLIIEISWKIKMKFHSHKFKKEDMKIVSVRLIALKIYIFFINMDFIILEEPYSMKIQKIIKKKIMLT